jgi:D-glycero-D-manno-heptose 1,7-bisphosphate phosphatase
MNSPLTRPKAVFIDRDGTLIEDKGYICDFSQVALFPFAIEAVRRIHAHGFKVIVITNQSAIARGICTEAQVEALHSKLKEHFRQHGAIIDAFYYSPYHEAGVVERYKKHHSWRKPGPGMILQAARDFSLSLPDSYVIGDDPIDIAAGRKAGCKTILVLTGKEAGVGEAVVTPGVKPDWISPNMLTAIEMITGS